MSPMLHSIKGWLMSWLLVVITIPLLVFVAFDIYHEHSTSVESARKKLTAIRDLKVRFIEQWADERTGDLNLLAESPTIRRYLEMIDEGDTALRGEAEHNDALGVIQNAVETFSSYDEGMIVEIATGRILLSVPARSRDEFLGPPDFLSSMLQSDAVVFSRLHPNHERSGAPRLLVGRHLHSKGWTRKTTKRAYALIMGIDYEKSLYPLLMDRTGLGQTGETLVIGPDSLAISQLRWVKNAPLRYRVSAQPALLAMGRHTGFLVGEDYRGAKVTAAYTWIPRFEWGLVAKQDYDEQTESAAAMLGEIAVWIALAWLITGGVTLLLVRRVTGPLESIAAASNRVASGDFSARVESFPFDELEQLSISFNSMAHAVQVDIEGTTRSSKVLGGIARQESATDLASYLCSALVTACGALIAVVYLRRRQDPQWLDAVAMLGVRKDTQAPIDVLDPPGTFAHAIAVQNIHYLPGLNDPRVVFETVAGDIRPAEVATLPLEMDGEMAGLIMLARQFPFGDTERHVLEQVHSDIQSAFVRMFQREEQDRLGRELQDKNQELETMTEELQQQSEELQVQNVTLEEQRRRLEAANAEKNSFLSNMSHELRTPLNAILTLARALQLQWRDRATTEEQQFLEVIDRNGRTLLEIINDLLELSRLESGRLDWSDEALDPSELLKRLVERLSPLATEKGLQLDLEVAGELPELNLNRRLLEMTTQNIITNAIKFTEHGSVTVRARSDAFHLFITVEDTGIGISSDNLSLIFDEFHQVDSGISRQYDGTGLGLAIAQKAVARLGGRIGVESSPGKGSIFTVELPLLGRPTKKAKATGSRPRSSGIEETQREHVLVVDDSDTIAEQLDVVLRQDGYTVSIAKSGQEALSKIKELRPDAILLDLMMPEMSGFEVLERLRSTPHAQRIPVLVITAKSVSKEERELLDRHGVASVFVKGTFDEEDLLQAIYFLFDNRASRTGPHSREDGK